VSNVLARLRKPQERASIPMQLPRQLQVAACELRCLASFARGHPPALELLLEKAKMCAEFTLKIRIGPSAGHQVPQLGNGLSNVPVHAFVPSRSSRSTNSDIFLQRVVSFSNAFRPARVIA
jgi:hypothetical protein